MNIYLVCGGRDYSNQEKVNEVLSSENKKLSIDLLVHGGCYPVDLDRMESADYLAELWAVKNGIHTAIVNARWDYYGKRAGPLRNMHMAALPITKAIVFPGGRGTDSMEKLLQWGNIEILKIVD